MVDIDGGGVGGSTVDEVVVEGRERGDDSEREEREKNVERESRVDLMMNLHWREIGSVESQIWVN